MSRLLELIGLLHKGIRLDD